MPAIETLGDGVLRSAGQLIFFFQANLDDAATLSSTYERREARFHVAQLTCADAGGSVDLEVSLDGTNWTVVATMTGLSVLTQFPHAIWPVMRVRRKDSTNAALTFSVYSCKLSS